MVVFLFKFKLNDCLSASRINGLTKKICLNNLNEWPTSLRRHHFADIISPMKNFVHDLFGCSTKLHLQKKE